MARWSKRKQTASHQDQSDQVAVAVLTSRLAALKVIRHLKVFDRENEFSDKKGLVQIDSSAQTQTLGVHSFRWPVGMDLQHNCPFL